MHVLITGGAGFIGSHLAELLLAEGHRVTILDDLSTGLRSNLPPGATFMECDITSPESIRIVREFHPDGLVHFAAQISVGHSMENPLNDLDRNVRGTINLLLAARDAGVGTFLFASSAAVYGVPRYLPVDEQHPMDPLSPYGLSKLTAESYISMLAGQYGIRSVILRYANVFGPRQPAKGDGAVVPAFLHSFVAGNDPVIHGDGSQTRDFIYVDDVARANLLALTSREQGVFNICTGVGTTIHQLWQASAGVTGWTRSPVHAPPRPGDIPHSVLSPEAARSQFGFAPSTDLLTGLSLTAASMQRKGN